MDSIYFPSSPCCYFYVLLIFSMPPTLMRIMLFWEVSCLFCWKFSEVINLHWKWISLLEILKSPDESTFRYSTWNVGTYMSTFIFILHTTKWLKAHKYTPVLNGVPRREGNFLRPFFAFPDATLFIQSDYLARRRVIMNRFIHLRKLRNRFPLWLFYVSLPLINSNFTAKSQITAHH